MSEDLANHLEKKSSLDARVNNEDVVHYALEGLPDKYNRNQALIHVLPRLKWVNRGCGTSENTTRDLLNKLLAQLGHLGLNVAMSNNGTNVTLPNPATITLTGTGPNIASIVPTAPHAFYASPTAGTLTHLTPPAVGSVHTTIGQVNCASQATQSTGSLVMGSAPSSGAVNTSGQATLLPKAFTAWTLHDPYYWCMEYGYRLNNVLITPHIVKNLIYVRQFVRDNDCTIEFDSFGFSVKDFITLRVLLRCDGIGDLYPVTAPSPIPSAFLVNQQTWHQRLGHPGSKVLRRLVSNNVISCNKEKPPILCHACQLGKHVWLSFVRYNTIVSSCFEIVNSDVWTSPITSLSGFKYYVLFLDHYSQFVLVFPLIHKSDVLSNFVLFRNYVRTQFKCEIRSFQCDRGGEFDNRKLHDLFNTNGIQFRFSCPQTSQPNGKSERMSKLGVDGDPVSDPTLYRSLAGSLQYLTFTRPDISYVVPQVCLYMHDLREPYFSALKRILRYVQGTLHYGLQLFSSSTTDLVAYSDADWAGCPTTRRSTSGYFVFPGNNLLSRSSKRQPTISRSSAEAKIVVLPMLLLRLRTKHIEIDIHFVRDLVAAGQEFQSSLSFRCPPAPTAGEC
nr:ribonuclease H-like domain-containing protein [Tanacetum cinerariifolium]